MTPQDFITKCFELSERASKLPWVVTASYDPMVRTNSPNGYGIRASQTDAELIAFSRAALPKVCEALKIAVNKLEHVLETEEAIGETLRTVLTDDCYEALDKINKLFDDADGG